MHIGGPGGSGQSAECEREDIEAGVVVSTATGEDGDDKETTIVKVKKKVQERKGARK